jgi:hypothetical protein
VKNTAAVVTSCTQRKSGQSTIDLAQVPTTRRVEQLARSWTRLVHRTAPICPAESLYQGRSIADASAVAARLGSALYVVSAGLGLVSSGQNVPAYECTVAAGSELKRRLKLADATTADWWNAITTDELNPIAGLVARGRTLVALPSSYLRMVREDLASVVPADARQLRIFTSRAGAELVPGPLSKCVMPYDDRLESVPNYAGTRSDFAQRAMRHFVEVLGATTGTLAESRRIVSESLAHQEVRSRPAGTRMSDDEIRRVLRSEWDRHEGRSTRLLRYLRDDARISCEQKRFSRIWQALAEELRA